MGVFVCKLQSKRKEEQQKRKLFSDWCVPANTIRIFEYNKVLYSTAFKCGI